MKKTARILIEVEGENVMECNFTDVENGEFNIDYEPNYMNVILIMMELAGNLMNNGEEGEMEVLH